jgi:hypothetical protein
MASNSSTSSAPDDPQDGPTQGFLNLPPDGHSLPKSDPLHEENRSPWVPEFFVETEFGTGEGLPVKLSQMELQTLAWLHLNRAHEFNAGVRSGFSVGSRDYCQAMCHEARSQQLASLLPEGDQQELRELIRRRELVLETISDPEEELREQA